FSKNTYYHRVKWSKRRVNSYMGSLSGWGCVCLAGLLGAGLVSAQTLNNQSLSGKYFFRYVSMGSDSTGNLSDPRSLSGTITFDNGNYTFNGQVVIGAAAAVSASGNKTYSVDPAGVVTMDSP